MRKIQRVSILSSLCLLLMARPAQSLEEIAAFNPVNGELPESITIDHSGNLYFSLAGAGEIRKLTPAGQMTTIGTLPIAAFALGVKVGPDGCVYNVSTSLSSSPSGAFVWRICTEGVVEEFAALDPNGGPNDLAFDHDGNLYVTDPFLGQIWKVTSDGRASVWLQHPLLQGNPVAPVLVFHEIGVDGIAFDANKEHLYVGNLDQGTIVRITLRAHGSAGDVDVFVSDPLLSGVDGIAFDQKGNLFAAVNAQDRLASIDDAGRITVLDQGGLLDGPSSVVFGTAPSDQHTLYIASSAFSRAFGFQSGTPHPALLSTKIKHKGLPLP